MVMDYLFCESKIIERLKSEVPDFREVLSTAGLEQMESDIPAAPSAYTVYVGDVVPQSGAATGGHFRKVQSVTQLWAVVICVYLADSRGIGQDANATAGPLITQTLNALTGWSPDGKVCQPMSRSPQQLPVQYENGYGYYPFVFQVTIPNLFVGKGS